jgi:glucose dehydrogenase
MRIGHLIVAIFFAAHCAAVPIAAQAQGALAASAGTVDDQRLLAAAKADGDWITFGRDFSNQRFAPLQSIDRSNVARLAPAWVYPLGTVGSAQTHPIVVGGVMYVGMAGNDVAAVDAATGREIWRYRHAPRVALPRVPSNRGVAVAYGRVFEATDDARVIALDQSTGQVVWDKVVQSYDASALVPSGQNKPDVGFLMRAAPLVYDGKVIVGATGFEANQFDSVSSRQASPPESRWARRGSTPISAAAPSSARSMRRAAPRYGGGTPPRRTAGRATTPPRHPTECRCTGTSRPKRPRRNSTSTPGPRARTRPG